MKKFHITSNNLKAFHAATIKRIDNIVYLEIYDGTKRKADDIVKVILNFFAKKGCEITPEKKRAKKSVN